MWVSVVSVNGGGGSLQHCQGRARRCAAHPAMGEWIMQCPQSGMQYSYLKGGIRAAGIINSWYRLNTFSVPQCLQGKLSLYALLVLTTTQEMDLVIAPVLEVRKLRCFGVSKLPRILEFMSGRLDLNLPPGGSRIWALKLRTKSFFVDCWTKKVARKGTIITQN